jgi:hypothetical protein
MKLSEIIHRNNWLSIESTFRNLYQSDEDDINAHKEAFEKLLLLPEESSNIQIAIRNIKEDEDEYYEVSGIETTKDKGEEKTEHLAIEFTPWSEWLGMQISKETVSKFNELEIISHCLYEMTYAGFTEEEIQNEFSTFTSTVEEYKSMTEEEKKKNTISLDELMKKYGIKH